MIQTKNWMLYQKWQKINIKTQKGKLKEETKEEIKKFEDEIFEKYIKDKKFSEHIALRPSFQ